MRSAALALHLPWLIFSPLLRGQNEITGDIRRLTVVVERLPKSSETTAKGTGVLAGTSDGKAYVVTASHVVGPKSDQASQQREARVVFADVATTTCRILKSTCTTESCQNEIDLALLECPYSGSPIRVKEVLGTSAALRTGRRVTTFGNLDGRGVLVSPPGYSSVLAIRPCLPENRTLQCIESSYGLNVEPQGFSGGPLLTDLGELVGIEFEVSSIIRTYTWESVKQIINCDSCLQLRPRSYSSLPALSRNVEIMVSSLVASVPGLGTHIGPVPHFRIGIGLPAIPHLNIGAEFWTGSGSTEFAFLRVSSPAVSAHYQLGSHFAFLRRSRVFGGLFVGSGLGLTQMEDLDTNRQIIPREWFGFYEAGLRYRIPQRSWGIAGSYREGVAFHQPQSLKYSRYRTFNIGVFVSFR